MRRYQFSEAQYINSPHVQLSAIIRSTSPSCMLAFRKSTRSIYNNPSSLWFKTRTYRAQAAITKRISPYCFSTAVMATESKIVLTPSVETEFAVPNLSAEAAERASRLLSENHEKYHMFFNDSGFHSMSLSFHWTFDFDVCALRCHIFLKMFWWRYGVKERVSVVVVSGCAPWDSSFYLIDATAFDSPDIDPSILTTRVLIF